MIEWRTAENEDVPQEEFLECENAFFRALKNGRHSEAYNDRLKKAMEYLKNFKVNSEGEHGDVSYYDLPTLDEMDATPYETDPIGYSNSYDNGDFC